MIARDKALRLLAGRAEPAEALNYKQLAEAAGCELPAMHKALAGLHRAGRIHVARFERSRGSPMPYWLAGPGADATPPPPLTNAEKQRSSQARIKADEKRHARRLKQRSRRYYQRKREEPEEWRKRAARDNWKRRVRAGSPPTVSFTDPLTAGLFGYRLDERGRYVKKA